MNNMKTVLFDFDGVIVDTEPIYDIFWDKMAERYKVGIDNFASKIKGTTLPDIMQKYFSTYPQTIQEQLLRECEEYETVMDFPPIPGAIEFIHTLKANGIQVGLVTSSDDKKVKRAFTLLALENLFDTIVTADRITTGKPHPMCYLLGAADLKVSPSECIVFEDSFAGIRSATAAGTRVIGVSSTNSAEEMQNKVHAVIPNFSNITFEMFEAWCK